MLLPKDASKKIHPGKWPGVYAALAGPLGLITYPVKEGREHGR
jgi:hypothetical protein